MFLMIGLLSFIRLQLIHIKFHDVMRNWVPGGNEIPDNLKSTFLLNMNCSFISLLRINKDFGDIRKLSEQKFFNDLGS